MINKLCSVQKQFEKDNLPRKSFSRNKKNHEDTSEYNKEYNENIKLMDYSTKYSSFYNNRLRRDKCRKIIYIKKQNINFELPGKPQHNNSMNSSFFKEKGSKTAVKKEKIIFPKKKKNLRKTILRLTPYQMIKQKEEEQKDQIDVKKKNNSYFFKTKTLIEINHNIIINNNNSKNDQFNIINSCKKLPITNGSLTIRNLFNKKNTNSSSEVVSPQILPNLNPKNIHFDIKKFIQNDVLSEKRIIDESNILSNIYIRSKCKSSRFLKSITYQKKTNLSKSNEANTINNNYKKINLLHSL